ncbi:MAG: ribose-phosphate pyrophosphokinase [Kosmotogaceae bacterium]
MPLRTNEMKIFAGSSNIELSKKIARYLGMNLGNCSVDKFADGETNIKIGETVRGHDVFIIQPTCPPVNERTMELLVMIDAFRRASANSIAVIMPYYGYARQDRKARGRDPISAKLVANLITVAGATRVLTVDIHAGQIQGFFDIPMDNLWSFPVFSKHLKQLGNINIDDLVVISPDIGGVQRASKFAGKLGVSLAILDKRRPTDDIAEMVNLIGEVKDKTVVIIDDIIDTGHSLIEAAKMLQTKGAKKIYVCVTHAILSGDAKEILSKSPIEKIFITDTVPHSDLPDKFEVVSMASLIGEAMMRIRKNLSVSILFK